MTFRPAAALLHASAAGAMAYGYRGLESLAINAWIKSQKGGHFQFLTLQGLAVAWLTMVMSLVVDLFPAISLFRGIKRTLFIAAMPVAVVVSSFYWVLLFLRPSLILIPEHDQPAASPSMGIVLSRIPLTIDLALHVSPVLTLLVDFIFLERKYTKKVASYGAPLVVALWTLWYSLWVEYCARFNGSFPYPFLENPFEIRVAIYISTAVLALLSFWAINSMHPGSRNHKKT